MSSPWQPGQRPPMVITDNKPFLEFFPTSAQAADAASTIDVGKMLSRLYLRSGLSAGRIDTLDTAAALIAALPGALPGHAFELIVQNASGFTLTLAAGTGGTLTAASTWTVPTITTKRILILITGIAVPAYSVYSLGAASAH